MSDRGFSRTWQASEPDDSALMTVQFFPALSNNGSLIPDYILSFHQRPLPLPWGRILPDNRAIHYDSKTASLDPVTIHKCKERLPYKATIKHYE